MAGILDFVEFPMWAVTGLALIFLYVAWTLTIVFTASLAPIRGPLLARSTRLYLFYHGFKEDFHTLYRNLHRKYGPIVRVAPNKVSISDPKYIPIIYGPTVQFSKSRFYDCFQVIAGGEIHDNVFNTKTKEQHKILKSPVAQAYNLSSLRPLEPLVNDCSKLFLDAMHSLAGQPIDLGEWLQWYAFDVVGKITFNQTFGFLETREDKLGIIKALETGVWYSSIVGQIPEAHKMLLGNAWLLDFVNNTPALDGLTQWKKGEEMMDKAIAEHKTTNAKKGDYLEFLRSAQEKNPERISDKQIRVYLSVNIGAGSDTTAMGLRAVLYYLVKNPKTYEKLQAEIDQADAERKLSEYVAFSEGQDLEYLQAVIKEAMRLHPGVGMPLERIVPEGGMTACGKFLPAGTVVGINAWVIHHNKEIYGYDHDKFRPERWLEATPERLKIMEQTFLSFGHGPRTCLGKNISLLAMTKFVPQLLRHFRLEWASDKDEWNVHGIWFARQDGMIMKVIPRKE